MLWILFTSSGLAMAQSASQSGEDPALMSALHAQIAARDQKITTLEARLKGLEARYGNENVSRLLLSNQLQSTQDQVKAMGLKLTQGNEANADLLGQLDQAQNDNQILSEKLAALQLQFEALQKDQSQGGELKRDQGNSDQPQSYQGGADDADSSLRRLFSEAEEWPLEGVQFVAGTAEFTDASGAALQELLTLMRTHLGRRLFIAGHSDDSDDDAENQRLSELRARAVAQFLLASGIDANRVANMSYASPLSAAANPAKHPVSIMVLKY